MSSPKGGGASTFLAFIGIVISAVSMVATVSGGISNALVASTLVLVAVVFAFMAGMNIKSAMDYANGWFDAKLEEAASKAVDAKMPDIKAKMDETVDEVLEEIANGRY